MDRVGLAALFDEGEPEQGAAAAQQALDEAARVASRLNSLLTASRPYGTAAVYEGGGMTRVELTRVADEALSAMPDEVHEEVLDARWVS
ncbi:hypothetical protein [Streptomyces albireticuli]|uniref:hypothetical protein n=1 Tax=Streptomyces albireticuli TaxID=1940 RepID=UPI0036B111B6